MSDSRPLNRAIGRVRHGRSVSMDVSGLFGKGGAGAGRVRGSDSNGGSRIGTPTPQEGREESSAEGAAIAATSTPAQAATAPSADAESTVSQAATAPPAAASAAPSAAASAAVSPVASPGASPPSSPRLLPEALARHGRAGRSRGHSRSQTIDISSAALDSLHSGRSSRTGSVGGMSGVGGTHSSGAGGSGSGVPAWVISSLTRKPGLLRSSSFDRGPSSRSPSLTRPGSPSQSSRSARAHAPSSRAPTAAAAAAQPEEPKEPPPPTASFIRARARWHAALALVVNAGGSALAARQAFIQSSFIFSKLSKEKQTTLQNQLRKANFKKGTVLYRQGEFPLLVYFITSGSVSVSTSVAAPSLSRGPEAEAEESHQAAVRAAIEAAVEAARPRQLDQSEGKKERKKGRYAHASAAAVSAETGPTTATTIVPPSASSSKSSSRSSEPLVVDTHVQRVLAGWYRDRGPAVPESSAVGASTSASATNSAVHGGGGGPVDAAPSGSQSSTTLNVPLFHLHAPCHTGEKESLRKVSLRDCTVVALTDLSAYVLRRATFRSLVRARAQVQRPLERALTLQEEAIRTRLAHALRVHYDKQRSGVGRVRSRLDLTPFAARSLQRLHGLERLRREIETADAGSAAQGDQDEEKQPAGVVARDDAVLRPSPPRATVFSASTPRQAALSVRQAGAPMRPSPPLLPPTPPSTAPPPPPPPPPPLAAHPPRFFPPKTPEAIAAHHRGVLQAQARLESEQMALQTRRAAERLRRKQAAAQGDLYKFGATHRSKAARALRKANRARRIGGRRVWRDGSWVLEASLLAAEARAAGYSSPSACTSSSDDDEAGASGQAERDEVAASVWHAFPHAYSQAQKHVYSLALRQQADDPTGAGDGDGPAERGAGTTPGSASAAQGPGGLRSTHAGHVAAALALHDAQLFRVVRRPGTAPAGHLRAAPQVVPKDLPPSASFVGIQGAAGPAPAVPTTAPRPATAAQPSPPPTAQVQTAPHHQTWPSRPDLFLSPRPATATATGAAPVPSQDDYSSTPILAERPSLAARPATAGSGVPRPPGQSLLSAPASFKHKKLSSRSGASGSGLGGALSMSAELLRHLEGQYMRTSVESDAISYTGRWMFFHAPLLRTPLPRQGRRLVRRPRTKEWAPFSIPSQRGAKRLDAMVAGVLQSNPLGVDAYEPPPAPLTSLLSAPRAGEAVAWVSEGGGANSDAHWRHLSPTQDGQVRRLLEAEEQAELAFRDMMLSGSPSAPMVSGVVAGGAEGAGSLEATPLHSGAATPQRTPRRASHRSPHWSPRTPPSLRSSAGAYSPSPSPPSAARSGAGAGAGAGPLSMQNSMSALTLSPGGSGSIAVGSASGGGGTGARGTGSPLRSPLRSPTASTSAAAPAPASVRPPSASASSSRRRQRVAHARHPSLDFASKTYTFRLGHSDAERGVAHAHQSRMRTDWEFDKLRAGRIDGRRALAAEEAARALTNAVAGTGTGTGTGASPRGLSAETSPNRSLHASTRSSRRSTSMAFAAVPSRPTAPAPAAAAASLPSTPSVAVASAPPPDQPLRAADLLSPPQVPPGTSRGREAGENALLPQQQQQVAASQRLVNAATALLGHIRHQDPDAAPSVEPVASPAPAPPTSRPATAPRGRAQQMQQQQQQMQQQQPRSPLSLSASAGVGSGNRTPLRPGSAGLVRSELGTAPPAMSGPSVSPQTDVPAASAAHENENGSDERAHSIVSIREALAAAAAAPSSPATPGRRLPGPSSRAFVSFTPLQLQGQEQAHSPPHSSRASCASVSNLAELLAAGELAESLHQQHRSGPEPQPPAFSAASPPRPAHIRVPELPGVADSGGSRHPTAGTSAIAATAPLSVPTPVARPPPGSHAALLLSFDPRRRETQAVRRSLADHMLGARSFAAASASGGPDSPGRGVLSTAGPAPGPTVASHPYPPKRSAASSVSMSHSHVYVYERGNAHAADAMRFLAATADHSRGGASAPSSVPGAPRPGSLMARTQQVLGSAEARAHSLFEQLQQFTVAPPRLQSSRSRRRPAAVG